ncbi:MAG: hypothetical protein B6D58_09765 [candidate division Zixibacteria bacterium 4484_95]|nr:MAG: hypothetical protein B6D58_09765 [candidate division Zixibacteria bacterium 4484_95]
MNPNASQEAHSHRVVREAMLVLEGKVFVEEIVSGQSSHQTLDAGDFVVFDRGVSHRIANNADVPARILHFKFLGEGKDRALFIEDKSDTSTGQTLTTSVPAIYTQDYRHFDSLIWQVPAWASAIFSFSITSAVLVLANSVKIESLLPSINASLSVSIFLLSVFIVLLLLLNVFLRFRLHQRVVFRPNRRNVPHLWYMLSGQSSLLLVLFIEAAVILCFALITAGIGLMTTIGVTATFLILGFGYVERSVRKLSAILRADRSKQHG